jgi:HlyD family secretion protein
VFAEVEITPHGAHDALLAPRDAIRVEDGRTRLLVLHEGRADARPIEVGVVTEAGAEILTGADVGDTVIVGAAARTLAPGMPVRVKQVRPDGTS